MGLVAALNGMDTMSSACGSTYTPWQIKYILPFLTHHAFFIIIPRL
jgi:hypothetical protein